MIDVKTGGQNADRVIREVGAEFGQRFGLFYKWWVRESSARSRRGILTRELEIRD